MSLQPGVKWVTPEIYDRNITFERQLRQPYCGSRLLRRKTRNPIPAEDVDLNPGAYTAGILLRSRHAGPTNRLAPFTRTGTRGANAYNGLQVDIEKRPSSVEKIPSQITLLANYTYAHANDYGLAENGGITDIGSSIGSGMSFYDPRQHAFETGPATYDHRHRVVASFVWSLPKLMGSNTLMRNVVGRGAMDRHRQATRRAPRPSWLAPTSSQTGNNLDRADYSAPLTYLARYRRPASVVDVPA